MIFLLLQDSNRRPEITDITLHLLSARVVTRKTRLRRSIFPFRREKNPRNQENCFIANHVLYAKTIGRKKQQQQEKKEKKKKKQIAVKSNLKYAVTITVPL